jgi:hypothetical protein
MAQRLGMRAVVSVEKQNAETRDHQRGINPDVRSEYHRRQHKSQADQKKNAIPNLRSWIMGSIEQRDCRPGRGLLLDVVIDIYYGDGHHKEKERRSCVSCKKDGDQTRQENARADPLRQAQFILQVRLLYGVKH